jgi:hypothetical protein
MGCIEEYFILCDNQLITSTARTFTYLTECKSTVQSINILKPTCYVMHQQV